MLVHVIKPGGARFESRFRDGTPDNQILAQLGRNAAIFGRQRINPKLNRVGIHDQLIAHEDETSPLAWDDPNLIVAVGRVGEQNEFIEERRLKGPPPPTPETAGASG